MSNAQFCTLGPFFDAGALMTSAKLYHYQAGTSTLKDIWSDRGEVTTLAQPFVSDANGVFAFFADGLYKLVVTDANDVVKYTWDNVLIQDFLNPSFSKGYAIASASTIAVGPESFFHITGSVDINTITGSTPMVWLCFDGTLSLNYSANLLTPGSVNLSVQAGDVVFLLNEGAGVWRVAGQISNTLLVNRTTATVKVSDGRTNTVTTPLLVTATTTNTPAAGIGTGLKMQAQSADETPSDFGAVQFAASDVTAGSEDTYFDVLLRVAGAALTSCYRWAATGAFKGIFTHANTADRTYTLPDYSFTLMDPLRGPSSCGSGSTRTHEGSVTVSSNGNYSGIHFYTDFTLNSSVTMTIPAGSGRLVIIATGTITINGTISGVGGGFSAYSATAFGTSQPGGGGRGSVAGTGGNTGCPVVFHGLTIQTGGAGGVVPSGAGTAGTQVTGSSVMPIVAPLLCFGGAPGGDGGIDGGAAGVGGRGGASIVLIAPTIILANTATLNTSGGAGGAAAANNGGGGGGGAGNVYIVARSFTDNGATFTQTGGTGTAGGAGAGASGAAGIKQINVYQ